MKIITAVFLLILGAIGTIIGMLPFMFAYPNHRNDGNSGPANIWELILVLSYEGKGLYLILGVALLLLSMFLFFKKKHHR